MVNGVELAPVLENKNLILQVFSFFGREKSIIRNR
jgi:hypothetical protein